MQRIGQSVAAARQTHLAAALAGFTERMRDRSGIVDESVALRAEGFGVDRNGGAGRRSTYLERAGVDRAEGVALPIL
ncbi:MULTISPECIES: hypothetical protein [Methylosinus]|uniref:hypothetical protein n=1 Tax=Methylosinus TaxID=425 RepID=UPI001FED83CF|nr:hypothetical protein [Methylosinus sporium]